MKQKLTIVQLRFNRYERLKKTTYIKYQIIDHTKHLALSSAHPSPFAANRGFFGNKHFSKANAYLQEKGLEPIDW